jgi:hypothetical protein
MLMLAGALCAGIVGTAVTNNLGVGLLLFLLAAFRPALAWR